MSGGQPVDSRDRLWKPDGLSTSVHSSTGVHAQDHAQLVHSARGSSVGLRVKVAGDPIPRFIAKVSVPDDRPETCWDWTGYIAPTGYGSFYLNGRPIGAHRAAYELFHGPIAAGQVVMHLCDRRSCVRPSHLSIGTYAENTADMVAKGRAVPGAHVPDPRPPYKREPAWLRRKLEEEGRLNFTRRRRPQVPI